MSLFVARNIAIFLLVCSVFLVPSSIAIEQPNSSSQTSTEKTHWDFTVDEKEYVFWIETNATLYITIPSSIRFDLTNKQLNFTAEGHALNASFFNVTIPKELVAQSSDIKVDIYSLLCAKGGATFPQLLHQASPEITESVDNYFVYFTHTYGPGCGVDSFIMASIIFAPDNALYYEYLYIICVIGAIVAIAWTMFLLRRRRKHVHS